MKRRFAIALAMVLSLGILAGRGGTAQQNPQADASAAVDTDKVKVVCATFPAYDWARQIVGDAAVEEEVVVTGIFDSYAEGEARYLHLVNASVRPTE